MTAQPIKLGILGAGGKMGRSLATLIDPQSGEFKNLFVGVEDLLTADVVVDFSAPAAFESFAQTLLSSTTPKPRVVTGTTGWTAEQRKKVDAVAAVTPTVLSSNFSLGAMTLIELMKTAGPLLESFGFRPMIIETHHTGKRDAPSGTALSLQNAIAPTGPGNIQTLSVRAGDAVGTHEVRFQGMGEQISFLHQATDRMVFARGALRVAEWITRANPPAGKVIKMEQVMAELSKRVAEPSRPSV